MVTPNKLIPPLEAHRIKLKLRRGAQLEDEVSKMVADGYDEAEARAFISSLMADVGPTKKYADLDNITGPKNQPYPEGTVVRKREGNVVGFNEGKVILDQPDEFSVSGNSKRLADLEAATMRLVDTGGKSGDVAGLLREVESLRSDIETGPTNTKAAKVRGVQLDELGSDDANPATNVSRDESAPGLLRKLDELESTILQGRSPREAVDYWQTQAGMSPPPPTAPTPPTAAPMPPKGMSIAPQIGQGTALNGVQAQFYEAPGRLHKAEGDTGGSGRFAETKTFPVIEIQVPEFTGEGGSLTTRPQLLSADVYVSESGGVMAVVGNERYLLDPETNALRSLSDAEYTQIAASFPQTPSGTPATTQAVAVQNKLNVMNPRDINQIPRQPDKSLETQRSQKLVEPPSNSPKSVSEVVDSIRKRVQETIVPPAHTPGHRPGDLLTDPSVTSKPQKPTAGFASGGRPNMTNDQARAAAAALSEFFRSSRLDPEMRGAKFNEAMAGLNELIGGEKAPSRISDLGFIDAENLPLEELARALQGKEKKSYGTSRFELPPADKSERHLLQAELEEATRYRDEVKKQLQATGEPLSRQEMVEAEQAVVAAQDNLANMRAAPSRAAGMGDDAPGMPQLVADEFNNIVGEYGRADINSYMTVLENLKARQKESLARGTKTFLAGTDGSVRSANIEATELGNAIQYMQDNIEPLVRGNAAGQFADIASRMGQSVTGVEKALNELRRGGLDVGEAGTEQLGSALANVQDLIRRLEAQTSGHFANISPELLAKNPQMARVKAGIDSLKELEGRLSQQVSRSALSGADRLEGSAAKYPEGAYAALNRYAMEDLDAFRELVENPEFATAPTVADGPGKGMSLAEQIELADKIEAAKYGDPLFQAEDARTPFVLEDVIPRDAVQTSPTTASGMAAIRAYLKSRNAGVPLWAKERVALNRPDGLPSRSKTEDLFSIIEDLELKIDDPDTPAAERAAARREIDRISREEFKQYGPDDQPPTKEGAPSEGEAVAIQQLASDVDGDVKAPGTLDDRFFYLEDFELPAIEEMVRAMSGALPNDPKLMALRKAAAEAGGLDELYLKGYLRMQGGASLESHYSKLSNDARNAAREADRLESVMERVIEANPGLERKTVLANGEEVSGYKDNDLGKRIEATTAEVKRLRHEAQTLGQQAEALLQEKAPGVRDRIHAEMAKLATPSGSIKKTLEDQLEEVNRQLENQTWLQSGLPSIRSEREVDRQVGYQTLAGNRRTGDLELRKRYLEGAIRARDAAGVRAAKDNWLEQAGFQPGELDVKADNNLLRALTFMRDSGTWHESTNGVFRRTESMPPQAAGQLEYLIRNSGSDPAKIEKALKVLRGDAAEMRSGRVEPAPTSDGRPEVLAENLNANDDAVKMQELPEMDSITEEINLLESKQARAESILQAVGADQQGFDPDMLDATTRAQYDEAVQIEAEYADKINALNEQLDQAAANYAPQWTQVRADLSSLRQGDFDPSTGREVTGQPFYAAGGLANEAALFSAATKRFRRADFLNSGEGLGGTTMADLQARVKSAEASLRGELGMKRIDDMAGFDDQPDLEDMAFQRNNELTRQLTGMQKGGPNLGEVFRLDQQRRRLQEKITEYQRATQTLEAAQGDEFMPLEPVIKTYVTDDNGNGYAIIQVPDVVGDDDPSVRTTKMNYTLKVPISFDESFRGDTAGRRVAMEPTDGGFEGVVTELRNGERNDVDWSTGAAKAKRFRKRTGPVAQFQAPVIKDKAVEERVYGPEPPGDFVPIPKEAEPAPVDSTPSRIRTLLGQAGRTAKWGGIAIGGMAAGKAAYDAMTAPADPNERPSEEELQEFADEIFAPGAAPPGKKTDMKQLDAVLQ